MCSPWSLVVTRVLRFLLRHTNWVAARIPAAVPVSAAKNCPHWRFALRLVAAVGLIAVGMPTGDATPARAAGGNWFPPAVQKTLRDTVNEALGPTMPGAIVGMWEPGHGSWTYAAGMADVATKRPARLTDSTYVGSITKTFIGTLVLQLVDADRLALDAPIGRWLPQVPDARQVTVRELLGHTSGIFNYTEDAAWDRQEFDSCTVTGSQATCARTWQPQALLAVAAKHRLYFRPGSSFHYSNTNFIILGMLLEKVTGQSLAELLQEKILRPLHLTHTYLRADAAVPPPSLHGYTTLPGRSAVVDVRYKDLSWGGSAGAVVSTLDDLHVWAQALATGKLLSAKLQAQRVDWSMQSIGAPGGGIYGLALAAFAGSATTNLIGHDGGLPGYTTEMWYLPNRRATIVIIVNGDNDGTGQVAAARLLTQLEPWL